MGTFTISQTQDDKNLYLIPDWAGCNTGLKPKVLIIGNHYQVDDPVEEPDEDDTYVYWDTPVTRYDTYRLPNHTTETGIINYIQVYARAKSYEYAQHENGIFKIIETDNNCANIYKSDDIDLTTGYQTYSKIWATNPRTSAVWTWTDIDNLQAGIECSSPSLSGTKAQATYRPNGDNTRQLYGGPYPNDNGTNWDEVDETIPDEHDTYVWTNKPTYRYDLYTIALTSGATLTGTIDKITVFTRCYNYLAGPSKAKATLKVQGGVLRYGTENTPEKNWTIYSDEWTLNPETGSSWKWSEVENLEVGIALKNKATHVDCTQIYLVVDYTLDPNTNPEIRTTQVYVKINYSEDIECTLDKPEEISVDHNQNIKMLNFWSGNRAVYGLARSNKTMVLTGKQYSTDACDVVECVRDMGENGNEIIIFGLGSARYDRTFRILSFGWKKKSDSPLSYEWILECEYA